MNYQMAISLSLVIFFVLPLIVLIVGYYNGLIPCRNVFIGSVIVSVPITIFLGKLEVYIIIAALLSAVTGIFAVWLTKNETIKKIVAKKLESEKESEYNKTKTEQDNVRQSIFQEEKKIKKLLYLYEITKKIATTLSWDDMIAQFNTAIQDYLGTREVIMFVPDENKKFGLVSKRGSFWSGEEKKIEQTHDFYSDKKIVFDSTNALLTMPLWLENKLLATFIVKITQRNNLSDEELLFESEALSNSLILGIQKANLYREVENRSRLDGLTGLYRRHYFFDRLETEIRRAKKFGTVFCIVMTDIDHFKKCNDTYGHQAGDEVLRTVAKTIKENIYETDMVARYGGEEFVLLLSNADLEGTFRKMENIRTKISEQELVVGFEKIKVTTSFGISQYPTNGFDGQELLRCADDALYYSKNNGRNRVTYYGQLNGSRRL